MALVLEKMFVIFVRISALVSKKRSNKKSNVRVKINHSISCIKCPYFFISPLNFKKPGQKFRWFFG